MLPAEQSVGIFFILYKCGKEAKGALELIPALFTLVLGRRSIRHLVFRCRNIVPSIF